MRGKKSSKTEADLSLSNKEVQEELQTTETGDATGDATGDVIGDITEVKAIDISVEVPEATVVPKANVPDGVPFSRLSKIGKYITLLEIYEGDYPRGSNMNEFLACLRPLVFELQLYENIKDNKKMRDNVLLPCGCKGIKDLQANIKYYQGRVEELYNNMFNDVFTYPKIENSKMTGDVM